MTYVPTSSAVVAVTALFLFVFISLIDVVALARRRQAVRAFPGGPRRLAWAIALYAAGRTVILLLTLLLPMSLLLAAGAAAGLPEMVGYVIIFVVAGLGTLAGSRLGVAVEAVLASPLLQHRAALMASPVTGKTGAGS